MAQRIKDVNFFRLFIVIGLSMTTSLAFFFADEDLTRAELFNTLIQAAIVCLSFLQCPEISKKRGEQQ